jgi:hypothetical protein
MMNAFTIFVVISIIILVVLAVQFKVWQRYNCTEKGCEKSITGKYDSKISCSKKCKKVTFQENFDPVDPNAGDGNDPNLGDGNDPDDNQSQSGNDKDDPQSIIPPNPIITSPPPSFEESGTLIGMGEGPTTMEINMSNVDNIREQIKRKKGWNPYFATQKEAMSVTTDYDVFPYPRYFRGIATSSEPIVAEREAGYRNRHDDCYIPNPTIDFQPPCVVHHKRKIVWQQCADGSLFQCTFDDENCKFNSPSFCPNAPQPPQPGQMVDHVCANGNVFQCPAGTLMCYDNSPQYCP